MDSGNRRKPQLIESEYVRYLFFLQLRNYLLKGDMQLPLDDEAMLAACAVQSALGNYDPLVHTDGYLNELKFISNKSLSGRLVNRLPGS